MNRTLSCADKRAVRLTVSLLLFVCAVSADQIVLRGGGKIRGVIESEDERGVSVRLASGTIHVPSRRIETIIRESVRSYGKREATDLASQARVHRNALRLDAALRDLGRICKLDASNPGIASLENAIRAEQARGAEFWKSAEEALGAKRI